MNHPLKLSCHTNVRNGSRADIRPSRLQPSPLLARISLLQIHHRNGEVLGQLSLDANPPDHRLFTHRHNGSCGGGRNCDHPPKPTTSAQDQAWEPGLAAPATTRIRHCSTSPRAVNVRNGSKAHLALGSNSRAGRPDALAGAPIGLRRLKVAVSLRLRPVCLL